MNLCYQYQGQVPVCGMRLSSFLLCPFYQYLAHYIHTQYFIRGLFNLLTKLLQPITFPYQDNQDK